MPTGINEQMHMNLTMKDRICIPLSQPTKQNQPAQRFAVVANTLLSSVNIKTESLKKMAILDSGATSHFLVTNAPVTQLQLTKATLKVRIPDNAQVK